MMPRLIFKCPYLPPGGGSDRGGYAAYIATRDGVEVIPAEKRELLASANQRKLIQKLLRDFPDAADSFEHDDYIANPTAGNASEFITHTLENNYMNAKGREGYVGYISERPRVAKVGEHGLFDLGDGPLTLSRVAEEIRNHPGNVWAPIFSLRREDAARLGYDNAANWQALLHAHADTLSRWLKIPPDDLVWYAAFHDEGHHPHVHMLCYSRNPKKGFLTKEGIRGIKSELTRDIFRCDLEEIYQRQTLHRNETVAASRGALREKLDALDKGVLDNEVITQKMAELSERLRFHSGKMVYGYLRPPVKVLVDSIVDELAMDSRVADIYALWCEDRQEVIRSYKDVPEPSVPLSRNKEFKQIRNLVVKEAALLMQGGFLVEELALLDEQLPMLESDAEPQRTTEVLGRIRSAAEAGNPFAQYALGKFLLFGDPDLRDEAAAVHWLILSAAQGNIYAAFLLDRREQWQRGAVLMSGTRLLSGIGQIFSSKLPAASSKTGFLLDRKRRKELWQKKDGRGIKQAELEQQEQQMSTM